ncbi:2'-5' RNA ligase [Prauserella sp. Am3]|nr:2'-5' RNA ligase [Prauserella sp. Am3]
MRLFSAFPVPDAAADALREHLARAEPSPATAGSAGTAGSDTAGSDTAGSDTAAADTAGAGRLRWTARDGWHVTLGFYGEDDPRRRGDWLARRLDGLTAPVLRIAGAGTFPGVLWAGIATRGDALAEVAAAARSDDERRPFRAHVTLARGGPPAALAAWAEALAGHRGPEWEADAVVLLRSDSPADSPADQRTGHRTDHRTGRADRVDRHPSGHVGGRPIRGPVYTPVDRFDLGHALR